MDKICIRDVGLKDCDCESREFLSSFFLYLLCQDQDSLLATKKNLDECNEEYIVYAGINFIFSF